MNILCRIFGHDIKRHIPILKPCDGVEVTDTCTRCGYSKSKIVKPCGFFADHCYHLADEPYVYTRPNCKKGYKEYYEDYVCCRCPHSYRGKQINSPEDD